jgi:potassium-transporting ATPase KdpC subunit
MNLKTNFLVAILMTVVTTVLLGLVYPLVVTGLAQLLYPGQANGQLVEKEGRLVGSRLIGQPFSSPGYFRPRPSAAGPAGYDASASGGSNLGPTNASLVDAVRARTEAAHLENPGVPVPVDLVTSSASGLDPDISPAAAAFQVPRVARERGVTDAAIRELVAVFTRPRDLGVLGEPRVNVLLLNLALDGRYPIGGSSSPANR